MTFFLKREGFLRAIFNPGRKSQRDGNVREPNVLGMIVLYAFTQREIKIDSLSVSSGLL